MKVSAVIPNLNGKKILEKNLPKLFEAVSNSKNNIGEVIVVDNNSSDDSVDFLIQNYGDRIRLIRHKKDRGFSAAVNTGVRSSKGEFVLLINNDVIPETDFLENILPHFKNPKVFAVSIHERGYGSAKGYFGDGYIQLAMRSENEKPHQSFYVSGGSGVFRKSIWRELNGMDEALLSPFYWEDIDLCYRAAKRGYANLWEPRGYVVHEHEATISKFPRDYVNRVKERNQLLVIWKNIHSKNLLRKHILGLFNRLIHHPGYMKIVILAFLKFPVLLRHRRKEIKESVVSDEAVFAQYK